MLVGFVVFFFFSFLHVGWTRLCQQAKQLNSNCDRNCSQSCTCSGTFSPQKLFRLHWFPARFFNSVPSLESPAILRDICVFSGRKNMKEYIALKTEVYQHNSPHVCERGWGWGSRMGRDWAAVQVSSFSSVWWVLDPPQSAFQRRHRSQPLPNATPVKSNTSEQNQWKAALTMECSSMSTNLTILHKLSLQKMCWGRKQSHGCINYSLSQEKGAGQQKGKEWSNWHSH